MNALGIGILHFLWQGGVLAALLWMALRMIGGNTARYYLSLATLCSMVGVSAATVANSWPSGDAVGRGSGVVSVGEWVGYAWCVGVVLIALYHSGAWFALRRRIQRESVAAPGGWVSVVDGMRRRIPTPAVTVLRADWLASPSVYGVLRPVLLLPGAVMTNLPPEQLEAVLAHELAHILRRDFLVNLLQTAAGTLLFFHPAVAWVNGVIRREREFCCDNIAIAATGNRQALASGLLELEEQRSAMLAIGANEAPLKSRIERMLMPTRQQAAVFPALAMLATIAAVPLLVAQAEKMPSSYEKWLREDVAYIIEKPEEDAFVKLKTDEERQQFIGQFWQRRNPNPSSAENKFKEEHYRRIAKSNERFNDEGVSGWKTDRGRVYILQGPPDEIEQHPERGTEQWFYRSAKAGRPAMIVFEKGKKK